MGQKILYFCDFCKEECSESSLYSVKLPVWSNIEDEEGRNVDPYVYFENFEICECCLKKTAVVQIGFRKTFAGFQNCPENAHTEFCPHKD